MSKAFVDDGNTRLAEQRAAHERIRGRGHCPFCPKNLPLEHKKPILLTGNFWVVTENQYPYLNTKLHLLFILKRHAETLGELAPEEGAELFKLLSWAENKFNIPGGGIGMRFGKTDFSGGSVLHLHAQLVVPDLDAEGYAPTFFTIGKKGVPA